jgi:hypothetical protein
MSQFRFERRVALLTSVGLVAVVIFLVVRNQPFADPNLVIVFRIVLSLAVGALGATIPGFLGVSYSLGGFTIRAGGALALFVITFFGTPKVQALKLDSAVIELDRLRVVDLRTKLGPDRSDVERNGAPAYATVPISVRSAAEPARRATITKSVLRFIGPNNQEFAFVWRYFVTMHEERFGVWLGIDEDAHPLTVDPGAVVFREILHEPIREISWADVLKIFESEGPSHLEVILTVTVDGRELATSCRVDAQLWRAQVRDFVQRTGTNPNRITMKCLDPAIPAT